MEEIEKQKLPASKGKNRYQCACGWEFCSDQSWEKRDNFFYRNHDSWWSNDRLEIQFCQVGWVEDLNAIADGMNTVRF